MEEVARRLNTRQVLTLSLSMLLLIGVGFAAVPFVRSLPRSPASGHEYSQVDISDLDPGTYLWLKSRDPRALTPDVLVVRNFDGLVRAFDIPILDGKYLMPDQGWDRVLGVCANFGPDGNAGQLLRDGAIRCHDPQLPDRYRSEWQWSYAGERLGQWSPNLRQLEVVREGDFLSVRR